MTGSIAIFLALLTGLFLPHNHTVFGDNTDATVQVETTVTPSVGPTDTPTDTPTGTPTVSPTDTPTTTPSVSPTVSPSPEKEESDTDNDETFNFNVPFGWIVSDLVHDRNSLRKEGENNENTNKDR